MTRRRDEEARCDCVSRAARRERRGVVGLSRECGAHFPECKPAPSGAVFCEPGVARFLRVNPGRAAGLTNAAHAERPPTVRPHPSIVRWWLRRGARRTATGSFARCRNRDRERPRKRPGSPGRGASVNLRGSPCQRVRGRAAVSCLPAPRRSTLRSSTGSRRPLPRPPGSTTPRRIRCRRPWCTR